MQYAHCVFPISDYNAQRPETRKKENNMKTNTNRTFMQKIRDLIEDGVYAFAMCYAKGNIESIRRFEDQLH